MLSEEYLEVSFFFFFKGTQAFDSCKLSVWFAVPQKRVSKILVIKKKETDETTQIETRELVSDSILPSLVALLFIFILFLR